MTEFVIFKQKMWNDNCKNNGENSQEYLLTKITNETETKQMIQTESDMPKIKKTG